MSIERPLIRVNPSLLHQQVLVLGHLLILLLLWNWLHGIHWSWFLGATLLSLGMPSIRPACAALPSAGRGRR